MQQEQEVISAYTRADAIADGVLVDVSERAREVGFLVPVAITGNAYRDCVEWEEKLNKRKRTYQDESGRLHDVLWMAFLATKTKAATGYDGHEFLFELVRVPRNGRGRMPRLRRLKVHIGGGDSGEPVITIMLPGED